MLSCLRESCLLGASSHSSVITFIRLWLQNIRLYGYRVYSSSYLFIIEYKTIWLQNIKQFIRLRLHDDINNYSTIAIIGLRGAR